MGRYQNVITLLVLGLPCYMYIKELVSLLDKARQQMKKVKVKAD